MNYASKKTMISIISEENKKMKIKLIHFSKNNLKVVPNYMWR